MPTPLFIYAAQNKQDKHQQIWMLNVELESAEFQKKVSLSGSSHLAWLTQPFIFFFFLHLLCVDFSTATVAHSHSLFPSQVEVGAGGQDLHLKRTCDSVCVFVEAAKEIQLCHDLNITVKNWKKKTGAGHIAWCILWFSYIGDVVRVKKESNGC